MQPELQTESFDPSLGYSVRLCHKVNKSKLVNFVVCVIKAFSFICVHTRTHTHRCRNTDMGKRCAPVLLGVTSHLHLGRVSLSCPQTSCDAAPQWPEKGVEFPGTEVPGYCEPPYVGVGN